MNNRIAILSIVCIGVGSCKSSHDIIKHELTDSIETTSVNETWQDMIPSRHSSLSIPMDTLKILPVDAWYISKDGNLTLKVGLKDNRLIVDAIADSIPRQHTSHSTSTSRSKKLATLEKPPDKQTSKIDGFWITSGKISAAIVAIIVFFYLRKKGIINF